MKFWNTKIEHKADYPLKCGDNLLFSLLESRGIDEKDYDEFLNPLDNKLQSPYVFSDMQKAKERIEKAIQNKELILIWGDFDADGVTSTSILYKTFKTLDANFDYIIPDREKMGHGINTKFLLPYIAKNKPKVLITVDCGISNAKEISLIKNFGIDVILTDHHKAPDVLPEAYAIINPKAQNSLKEDLPISEIKKIQDLAGAGVAHKLAIALLENIENEKLKNEILVLACVGTIADVVPLLYENRTIAAKGIDLINKGFHKGIKFLFAKNNKTEEITSYDIAFILAPRINAAGRLSTADSSFRLLTEEDDTILNASLKELDNYNRIRQNLCDNIYAEALDIINNDGNSKKQKALILFNEEWHMGVIGIVASKLVEKFYKPVFIITKDDNNMARCSIRGAEGYNIAEILDENSQYFTGGFGGHALAGGFSFDLGQFSFEEIKTALLETFESKEDIKTTGASLEIDAILEADQVNEALIQTIKKLEPTGQNNPAPVFALENIVLVSKKNIGKEHQHIAFKGKKDNCELNCVWWKHSDITVIENEKFDLAFSPKINIFNGESTIKLYTVDIKSEKNSIGYSERKFYDHRMKSGILPQIEEYIKRPNLDITIFAKKIKTKAILQNYPALLAKISYNNPKAEDIMFFDYPPDIKEFIEVLNKKNGKIHLMKEEFDENVESYIKQLIGMLKYSTNNKNGEISIKDCSQMISTTEDFTNICLEILEDLGSLEILDVEKIQFLNPPRMENFYSHKAYEDLKSEFDKIMEFKKYIAKASLDDIEKLINS